MIRTGWSIARGTAVAALALLATAPAGAQYPAGWEIPDEPLQVLGGNTLISDINANTAGGFSPLEFFQVTVQGVVVLGTGTLDPFDAANPSTWAYVDAESHRPRRIDRPVLDALPVG